MKQQNAKTQMSLLTAILLLCLSFSIARPAFASDLGAALQQAQEASQAEQRQARKEYRKLMKQQNVQDQSENTAITINLDSEEEFALVQK